MFRWNNCSIMWVCCLWLLFGCESDGDGNDRRNANTDSGYPACSDGQDNDDDGRIDYPSDPGCTSDNDRDEADPPPAACADGLDNDEDGRIDRDDRGCEDAMDDDESDDPPRTQCADGMDNDADGRTDLDDTGCMNSADDDESDDPTPPVCGDGIDNDSDGFIDFPADPGCGSEFDNDETDDQRVLPQCADDQDNDGDGLFDIADPGCSSAADPRESDQAEQPACSNGLDDDGDGVIDFPFEPGCSAAGDGDEDDGTRSPTCGNGQDDDGDGYVDYPEDPGCVGVGDMDEIDSTVSAACSDELDNDRDGATDYPNDPGCSSRADRNEQALCTARAPAIEARANQVYRGDLGTGTFVHQGSCGGRGAAELIFYYRLNREIEALVVRADLPENLAETTLYVRRLCADEGSEVACAREPIGDGVAANSLRIDAPSPGDYYIFVDGAASGGGEFAAMIEEIPLAQCKNGIDDDADGHVDYPHDPGCLGLNDREEVDPDVLPSCADDVDNDGDGLVDFPLDRGCYAASDDDEVDACGQGITVLDFPEDERFVDGTTDGGTNQFNGQCGGNNRPEIIYRYVNPFNANLVFSVDNAETLPNTLVYARAPCVGAQAELACDNGGREGNKGTIRLDEMPPGEIFIFVDTDIGIGGPFRLTVESERLPPGCSDGRDNDGDGSIDQDDAGCADGDDEDELDLVEPPECDDGIDNDQDGVSDFPLDPGCSFRGGPSEADPEVAPECSDGVDNDMDGVTDFPLEASCASAGDNDEGDRGRGQCNNRIDDDDDGLTDYPVDPGCSGVGDLSEGDPPNPPQCFDADDNDRNGLVDYPFDPGCLAAGDPVEAPVPEAPVCSNLEDDDEDGIIDFPRDPGCLSAADGDEADAAFPPQCADGRDNDNNGRIDWPDDPGCRFAGDNREALVGQAPRRCADGVDNDDDGHVDLSDSGCESARDDDESDEFEGNHCSDEEDNDEDGLVDWPADDGCAAQGDQCEQAGYGLCNEVCEDLQSDPNHCGACGTQCEEGVECIDGFCGGLFVFEGILRDTPDADLGGWEVCHNDLYNGNATTVQSILDACDGDFVMMGCRPVNSESWQLLAMGERDSVFQNTGDRNNDLNRHNEVDWYFSAGYSIGFVSPNSGVRRSSCDVERNQTDLRMCWHTSNGRLSGGYRCGANIGLNASVDYERRVWTSGVGR